MKLVLGLLLCLAWPMLHANNTLTGKQIFLMCHVCEEINNFACKNPERCNAGDAFCITVGTRLTNRHMIISKQCHKVCPFLDYYYQKFSREEESPRAFVYARCCAENLCNAGTPSTSEGDGDLYSQYSAQGTASQRASNTGLVMFLSFLTALLQARKTLCLL
ncbi:glycosyl-phosphatidylinositol-anchored molecule-like protein [Trichosurus vulpecula]|uniref:glycosyl-phosphatidylinositol-anchored molecule-like protein n=1 Tax=Trichosurus vulpecula TaxID=9337 RepID=UPI00186B4EE3|nr:glycosyl-phosphatidylinositol-anchored molecule-like protein [Trichosurus vulpecula]